MSDATANLVRGTKNRLLFGPQNERERAPRALLLVAPAMAVVSGVDAARVSCAEMAQ